MGIILIAGFWLKNEFEKPQVRKQEESLEQARGSSGMIDPLEESIAKIKLDKSGKSRDSQYREPYVAKNDQTIRSPIAGVYYIQVGAFNNWEGVVARIKAWHGYQDKEAVVYGPNESGHYKVWLGPFQHEKAAKQFIEEFDIPGFLTILQE